LTSSHAEAPSSFASEFGLRAARLAPIRAGLRKRGHSHGRALRSVADRLLAVACAMLKTQSTFNPEYAAEAAPA
jgi:hypothetical protein